MMNTRDIEAFVAVVETGSIVAASARLHLTQPGVTRRIQSLEERLGAVLLDRQSKPLKPTAAGREAYELGRGVLRSVADLDAGLAPGGEPSGEFRIGITPFLAQVALGTPVDRLRAAYPRLYLRISAAWSPALLARIAESRIDAAAVFLPETVEPPEDHLARVLLGAERVIVVASPALGLPPQASLQELSRYPWVVNQDGCGFRQALHRALEATRLPFEVAGEALGPDLQLSLIARGMGLGMATRSILDLSPLRDEVQIV